MASPDQRLAYVLGTFPQASQTFIAREVRGLRNRGVPIVVFALAKRTRAILEAEDRQWFDEVRFAPFFLAPSVLAANLWWWTRAGRRYVRALAQVVGLPHRPRAMALRAIALVMTAAWIAREIERTGGCRQIHAHFALAQTEVAMAVSILLERPFSFTAHARDIYATPSALEHKMRAAALVVTCTGYNRNHLQRACPDLSADRIQLVHHGVDLRAVTPRSSVTAQSNRRLRVMAAGRLVEKKGFDVLIEACARLRDRGVSFESRIYGTGPLRSSLADAIKRRGLEQCVSLPGWVGVEALAAEMNDADIFVMPSRVSKQGDRDGIPNVILEAMAAALPIVATRVSGIPEAVIDGSTGILVEPDNAAALADGLEQLITDQSRRHSMGDASRARALAHFDLAVSSERLATLFGQ